MKHKHYDVIIAHANGEQIQYRLNPLGEWHDSVNPSFYPYYEYRVKPKIRTFEYRLYLTIGTNYPLCVFRHSKSLAYLEDRVNLKQGRWLTDWLTVEYEDV